MIFSMKKNIIVSIIIFAVASHAQQMEDYSNLPNAEATTEEYEALLANVEKCKGSTDANCLIDTLESPKFNVELLTACSIDSKIHPDCSLVIPPHLSSELESLQSCLKNPNQKRCNKLTNEQKEILQNNDYEAPMSPEEITAMYDEVNALVTACVVADELPPQQYIHKKCSEVVPDVVYSRYLELVEMKKNEKKDN